jgi:hypothetical protein
MAEARLPVADHDPDEDFSRYRTQDLFHGIRSLNLEQRGRDYRLLAMLRELDRRDNFTGLPYSIVGWLAETFGISYGAAREKVRSARALAHLPLTETAFREGHLSYSKVRALTRVARPDDEAALLNEARHLSADALEKLVMRYRQRERLDDVQQLIRQRSLTWSWDVDGSLVVRARLTPEQGAIWLKALEKAESAIDSDDEFQIRQADALTHALEESLLDGRDGTEHKDRPRVADHYQAVVHVPAEMFCRPELADRVSAETSPADVPAETACEDGCSAQLPTRPALPRRWLDFIEEKTAVIENGPVLHPATVRRLTCDGALISVLHGFGGEVLNIGTKTRVIPPAIRRALKARDGVRCQYPGCSRARYLRGHHIVHWADGGETKLDNLVLLCSKHHTYVHEWGLSVIRTERGFRFAVRESTG